MNAKNTSQSSEGLAPTLDVSAKAPFPQPSQSVGKPRTKARYLVQTALSSSNDPTATERELDGQHELPPFLTMIVSANDGTEGFLAMPGRDGAQA
jgi:hypothetical protein